MYAFRISYGAEQINCKLFTYYLFTERLLDAIALSCHSLSRYDGTNTMS